MESVATLAQPPSSKATNRIKITLGMDNPRRKNCAVNLIIKAIRSSFRAPMRRSFQRHRLGCRLAVLLTSCLPAQDALKAAEILPAYDDCCRESGSPR